MLPRDYTNMSSHELELEIKAALVHSEPPNSYLSSGQIWL